jgi:hypothetical protein
LRSKQLDCEHLFHINDQVHGERDIHLESWRVLYEEIAHKVLSARERSILDDRMAGMTLSEAGAKRGKSGEAVRQVEARAIKEVHLVAQKSPRRRRKPTDVGRLSERYVNAPRQARVICWLPTGATITDFEAWVLSLVSAFSDATPEQRRQAWKLADELPAIWRERAKRRE